jgi:hypothetical protein
VLAWTSYAVPMLWRTARYWEMVRPMIIKQGEFVSFAPTELHAHKPSLTETAGRPAETTPAKPEANQSEADLLCEVERLVRENERLVLERDQLRDELSRQSLEARRTQQAERLAQATEPKIPETLVENLRRQPLTAERSSTTLQDDPGYELARVVVNWFWEDADEASVRLVHDALVGQGIRTIVRDDEEDEG